jgi:hypothetical protein
VLMGCDDMKQEHLWSLTCLLLPGTSLQTDGRALTGGAEQNSTVLQ